MSQCVCGEWFRPKNARQKFCSRKCAHKATQHRARTKARATREIEFIGVDGEGVNILHSDGTKTHRYVMLSVGDDTLWNNGEELTHHEIFPFLYDCFLAHPDRAFVGFYLGYDFTMWLKSLREDRAKMLFQGSALRQRKGPNPVPFPVYVDGWELDMLGLRRFKLRPGVEEGQKNNHKWLYICDTGAYFQTSFLNVIDPTKWPEPICTPEEYETILEGKNARSNEVSEGDVSYLPTMAAYNRLENSVLSRVMFTLNKGFLAAGVKLQRDSFYGPGQAIQKWLDIQAAKGAYLKHSDMEQNLPEYVTQAFQASYYGGRFEIFYHGHIPGDSYEYDITSAYPHAMRMLPCLCKGHWTSGTGSDYPNATIVLVYGTFRGSQQKVEGLPYRNTKGNILYPTVTRGWYLLSETLATNFCGKFETEKWIAFEQECEHPPPLAGIADLFYERLRIGKKTPQGMAIKLMINSAYGKFAQSIGNPKYGNPVYASMITSKCREMILNAIATHPSGIDDLLMVATDGIYFRTPHPVLEALPDHEQLGGWEPGVKHNLTLMKPGVYWDDKARDAIRNGQVAAIKSRGISAASLSANIGRIDESFRIYGESGCSTELPSLDVSVTFSVTSPNLALSRGKWNTCGHIEWDGTRQESASLAPKRTRPYVDRGYVRSYAYTLPKGEEETTPYERSFGFLPSWGFDQEGELSAVIPQTIITQG